MRLKPRPAPADKAVFPPTQKATTTAPWGSVLLQLQRLATSLPQPPHPFQLRIGTAGGQADGGVIPLPASLWFELHCPVLPGAALQSGLGGMHVPGWDYVSLPQERCLPPGFLGFEIREAGFIHAVDKLQLLAKSLNQKQYGQHKVRLCFSSLNIFFFFCQIFYVTTEESGNKVIWKKTD